MFVDYAAREINVKVVYYGPGLAGKTSTMQNIYTRLSPEGRGRMLSLATETERHLLFHFPVKTITLRGFTLRAHAYTIPGSVFYDASRKSILKGVDGVIFLADSQQERREANLGSLENLAENLATHGLSIEQIPLVFQYNKRDLLDALPLDDLEDELNPRGAPSFPSVAHRGDGVFQTMRACLGLIYRGLAAADPSGSPR